MILTEDYAERICRNYDTVKFHVGFKTEISPALRLTLHAFSLDDIDGDGKRCKNREADCQRNAGLHSDIETFVWIDTLNNNNTTRCPYAMYNVH